MCGEFFFLFLLHSSTALVQNRRCQRSSEDAHQVSYEELIDDEVDSNYSHDDGSDATRIEKWPESNTPTCGIAFGYTDRATIYNFSDGVYDRCISVITPPNAPTPMPVLFWFHGTGADAGLCPKLAGSTELAVLSETYGFAIVCAEALQKDGVWALPEIQTAETGTRCDSKDSPEREYVRKAIWHLAEARGNEGQVMYAHEKIFFAGVSNGAGMTQYSATCWKEDHPEAVSAFAVHSTGLKKKGDGFKFPDSPYTGSPWGECDGCQYFPIVPKTYSDELGLKACIFMGTGDRQFYDSADALRESWESLGNNMSITYYSGMEHAEISSYEDIVACLDDHTGRLMSSHATTTTSTTMGAAANAPNTARGHLK